MPQSYIRPTCFFPSLILVGTVLLASFPPTKQKTTIFHETVSLKTDTSYDQDSFGILKIWDHPSCAGNRSYCENLEEYPEKFISDVLKMKRRFSGMFMTEKKPIIGRLKAYGTNNICESKETVIYPRLGRNKNGEWRYIINQKGTEYVQGLVVEICGAPDRPCFSIEGTVCKQLYQERRMLSVVENKNIVKDSFVMPSVCCCSYEN